MDHSACCTHCGQRIRKVNPHHMDAAKVRLLERVAKLNESYTWVKVQRDGQLISAHEQPWTIQCDDVHALRLTWFQLLERKEIRSGLYRVTQEGLRFLQGRYSVPAIISCKEGVVVDESEEQVYINDVRNVVLDKAYWDTYQLIQVEA